MLKTVVERSCARISSTIKPCSSFRTMMMMNRNNHQLLLQQQSQACPLLRYASNCCHQSKKHSDPSSTLSSPKAVQTTETATTPETTIHRASQSDFVNTQASSRTGNFVDVSLSSSDLSSSTPNTATTTTLSPWTSKFWTCKHSWKRASFNTLNCLIGCSIGDFGMLWFLTSQYPTLSMAFIMPICMASGIATSLALETTLLKWKENFSSVFEAFKVACKMSFFSMAIMELSENVVDYAMMTYWGLINNDGTGCTSMLQIHEPAFWISLVASLSMGYLVPLPYNYYQLKKHGKSCH